MEQTRNFQVNLTGLIDLLSNHLYSNPLVFVRELLQNCVDAITARKKLGYVFNPNIVIETYEGDMLSIQDTGIGLSEQDIIAFLASIGSSSKRGNLDGNDDFIGQFGIGLLSCFVVSDEIVLLTRSALEGDSLEWKGKPDGTYTIRKLETELPIGSTVYLKAKPEYVEYFSDEKIGDTVEYYGSYLDVNISISSSNFRKYINIAKQPWKMTKEEAINFVMDKTGRRPLDIIPLHSTLGGVEGFAAILNQAVNIQEKKRHHVYLKNMLLSTEVSDVLPKWAFFVDAYINSTSLKPTASRETFQTNPLFYLVQEELGETIKQYIKNIARLDPKLFQSILNVHYQSIKRMSIEDEEIYKLIIPFLKFQTTYGQLDMATIVREHNRIFITSTVDEFRQIARVAKAQQVLVINGGYQFDFELLLKLPLVWEDVQLEVVDVLEFSNRFTPLSLTEQEEIASTLENANDMLKPYQCEVIVRYFEPADLPVFYSTNNEWNFNYMLEESIKISTELFAGMLNMVKQDREVHIKSNLCLNLNNVMVRKVLYSHDKHLQQQAIQLFYTQSLLMGNFPMSNEQLKLMNDSLFYFMNLGIEQIGG